MPGRLESQVQTIAEVGKLQNPLCSRGAMASWQLRAPALPVLVPFRRLMSADEHPATSPHSEQSTLFLTTGDLVVVQMQREIFTMDD